MRIKIRHEKATPCGSLIKVFGKGTAHESWRILVLLIRDKTLIKAHCEKYCNSTLLPGMEILWKGTVSAQFRANCPKLCGTVPLQKISIPGNKVELRYFSWWHSKNQKVKIPKTYTKTFFTNCILKNKSVKTAF